MRNVLSALFLSASLVANAQTATRPVASTVAAKSQYGKPFRVNLAVGYALPKDRPNDEAKGGFMFSIEPQYVLIPNVEVGLRLEQAFIQRAEFIDNVTYYVSNAKSISSAALTVNYVMTPIGRFRPYIGIGAGFYHVEPSVQTALAVSQRVSYPLPVTNIIGGLARIGVKFGTINLEGDFNLINNTSITNAATNRTLTANNSYISVKAGYTIGKNIH